MSIGEKANISERKIDDNIIIVTYPYNEFNLEKLYAEFTAIKNFFINKDVIMIPEELHLYNSTEELIDIRNRIDRELQRRRVRDVKKVLWWPISISNN